jgi:hypothetical protein
LLSRLVKCTISRAFLRFTGITNLFFLSRIGFSISDGQIFSAL